MQFQLPGLANVVYYQELLSATLSEKNKLLSLLLLLLLEWYCYSVIMSDTCIICNEPV